MDGKCVIPGGELTECKCSFSDIYETTQLANAIHQVPHLNYLFEHVSSNFSYSVEYVQGVAFWGVCLVALFLFIMVHCLCYSFCMCLMVRKSKKSSWEKWSKKPNVCLTIFGVVAFFGLAVCAIGIWSDIMQNDTLINFVNVFKSTNNLITTLDKDIKSVPVSEVDRLLQDISIEINTLPADTPDLDKYKQDVTLYLGVSNDIKSDVREVTDKLEMISLGQLDEQMEQGVKYRLIATLLLFSITAVLLFISIIYAIKPIARCTGFVFLFIILLFFCIWWLLGSIAFTADIALADFCIFPNPDAFIQNQITNNQQYKAETQYLLYCHGCDNPFQEYFTKLNNNFQEINATLHTLTNFTSQHKTTDPLLYTNTLELQLNIIQSFLDVRHIVLYDLDCNRTSALYALAIEDGCYNGLLHFTIETACAMLLAVIFLVLTTAQCFNACRLTAYYSKKNTAVDNRFEGLPDISPVSPRTEPSAYTAPSTNLTIQQDPDRVVYRRSHSGVGSGEYHVTDQQQLIAQSGVKIYPNVQLNDYPPNLTTNPIQYTNNFYPLIPPNSDYTFYTDPEMNVSRASSMEDNLNMYFPELASSMQEGEPRRHPSYSQYY